MRQARAPAEGRAPAPTASAASTAKDGFHSRTSGEDRDHRQDQRRAKPAPPRRSFSTKGSSTPASIPAAMPSGIARDERGPGAGSPRSGRSAAPARMKAPTACGHRDAAGGRDQRGAGRGPGQHHRHAGVPGQERAARPPWRGRPAKTQLAVCAGVAPTAAAADSTSAIGRAIADQRGHEGRRNQGNAHDALLPSARLAATGGRAQPLPCRGRCGGPREEEWGRRRSRQPREEEGPTYRIGHGAGWPATRKEGAAAPGRRREPPPATPGPGRREGPRVSGWMRGARARHPEEECGDPREEEGAAAGPIGPGRRWSRSNTLSKPVGFGRKGGGTREEEKCRRFCYERPREEVGTFRKKLTCRRPPRGRSARSSTAWMPRSASSRSVRAFSSR